MKLILIEDAHDRKVRAKLAEEDSNYAYVGRENKYYGLAANALRNTNPIEKVGSREKSLELYQRDISAGIKAKGPIYRELQRLFNIANRDDDGKPLVLVCWCKKEETPRLEERFCHADIIRNAIMRWHEIEQVMSSNTFSMEIRESHRAKGGPDRVPVTPKIFIGGSRSIKQLTPSIKARIDNIIEKQLPIVIGDAGGADTAFQKYLAEKGYDNVTVFCTGSCRNNVGNWGTRIIAAKAEDRLRVSHEAKDKKMAEVAHFGLMAWDATSLGTLSNTVNLLGENKKSVVFFGPDNSLYTIGDAKDLSALLKKCDKKHLELFDRELGLRQRLEQLEARQKLPLAKLDISVGIGKSSDDDTHSQGYAR
jgi:hypothetical protein